MTAPTDPMLQALAERLQAAGPTFDLTPALLQAPQISDLFPALLGLANGVLPVTAATVDPEADRVVLRATCGLFGVTGVAAQAVFTAASDTLTLTLTAPLGERTVQQLYSGGILPGAVGEAGSWMAGLAALPDITLTFDSQAQTTRFTGPPAAAAWGLLGLAGAALTPPAPAISIMVPITPATPPAPDPDLAFSRVEYHPRFTTSLEVGGASIPIYLELPSGGSSLRLGLNAPAPGLRIGDLSALSALTGDGTNLPSGVIALNQVWVTGLDMALTLADGTPSVWWFDLGVAFGEPGGANPPVWTILENVLALADLQATLSWTLYVPPGGGRPTGSARGAVTATILVADHPVAATLDVPVGPDGWGLSSAAPVPLAGLSDLAAYFGDATYLSQAIAPLGSAEGFALTGLACRFHPPPNASLDEIDLELTVTDWSIPALPWFQVSEIVFGLDVLAPLNPASRDLTAHLSATLTIDDRLVIGLEGAYGSADGRLDMAWSGQPLDPGPISALSALVTPEQVAGATPAGLPTTGEFFLKTLALSYDTRQAYLASLDLSLEALVDWVIVPDKFVLNGFEIDLRLTKDAAGAPVVVTGAIRGALALVGVAFDLAAEKSTGTDPWVLSAVLGGGLDLDFSELLSQLTGTTVRLPSGYGFPTALTLLSGALSLAPSTGAFSFKGAALTDWSVAFGGTTFAITGLGGQVDVPGGTDPATGKITGDFSFGAISGSASLALGAGATHTVITLVIGDPGDIAPAAQVDAIAGAGVFASAPRPADLPLPSFASAGAVLDLTANSYLVHGAFGAVQPNALYGGLALQVAKAASGTWGYAFAATLAHWTFARLSPALAIVDQVFGVQSASAAIALSSLDGDAGQAIAQYVPAIAPGFKIRKGVNFYTTLTFGGGLMAQVAALLNVQARGPFTLSGYIPAEAGDSQFTATLGELSFLNTLAFSNLVLTYAVGAGRRLDLTGDLAVSIPIVGGAQALTFHGVMAVDDLQATFAVSQTAQSVVNPLGLPGITLSQLALNLVYVFAAGPAPANWTLSVQGDTTIGPVALTGQVLFKDGAAALAVVALSRPVSIDAVFTQIIGSAWPPGLLNITFKSGEIWYAPAAVTLGGRTWDAGLNAAATIDVYILKDLRLQARMIAHTGSTPGGLTAQVQYGHAIDWGFVKLYQDVAHPTVGPAVGIDSTAGAFTVRGGFELFGAAVADVALNVTRETMRGSATFTQDLGPFGRPTVDFTWDDTGFHVDNWPLAGLKLPDFSFDDIPGTGECASVVVSKLPIKSKFNLRPRLSITATPRPALRITLDGTFDLVCNSAAYSGVILSANIAQAVLDVPLPLSGTFDWDALGEAFVACLKGAGASIFKNLVEDPANLAKLLAVGGIEFAAGEIVSYLVCRGTPQAAAEAFAEAATGAVATEVVIDGVAIALGGVAGAIIGGVFHNGGSSNGDGGGGSGPPRPASPAAPALSWSNGVHVTWPRVDNANSYVVAYRADGGGWTNGASTGDTFADLGLRPGPLYTVAVVAAGPGGVSAPGSATDLQTLAAPAGLTATYADGVVQVSWQPVRGAAPSGYAVGVTQAGGPLSPPPQVSGAGPTGATVAAPAFEAGGDFVISVTASSSVMTGPAATTPLHIALLPAPTGLSLSNLAQEVEARWTPVSGATGYRIRVFDAHGQPLSPQPHVQVDPSGGTGRISGPPLADGQTVGVSIAASAAGMAGAWSPAVPLTLVWLTAPTFSAAFDETSHALTLSYEGTDPRATGYETEVFNQLGDPLQPRFAQILSPSPATFPADRLVSRQTYLVRLRATAPNSFGAWASVPPLDLTPLAPPTAIAVTNDPTTVVVTFQPATVTGLYEAEILDAAGHPLVPPLTVQGGASPLVLPADRLSSGQSYGVRLRAIAVSGPSGPGD